jgi:hypothetical protein
MKIGFSFGRCVNDIINDQVALDDVLLIICRTKMADEQIVSMVISEYFSDGYISGSRDKATEIGLMLFRTGRLFQPRLQGFTPPRVSHSDSVWMDLAPTANSTDPNVLEAWRNYQLIARLVVEEKPVIPSHIDSSRFQNELILRSNLGPVIRKDTPFNDDF